MIRNPLAVVDRAPVTPEQDLQPRYAVYFAPAPENAWWKFGCRWLGRDAVTGESLAQPKIEGMGAERLWQITAWARCYGFHATLKPPFRLAPGCGIDDLFDLTAALAQNFEPFPLPGIEVCDIGEFVALQPVTAGSRAKKLAARCVLAFDRLRQPPDQAELAKRRSRGLTAQQEQLLARWGYPYVLDEFRFHFTLTDPVPRAERTVATAALQPIIAALNEEPLPVDALALFEQRFPQTPFMLKRRYRFDGICEVYGDG